MASERSKYPVSDKVGPSFDDITANNCHINMVKRLVSAWGTGGGIINGDRNWSGKVVEASIDYRCVRLVMRNTEIHSRLVAKAKKKREKYLDEQL